MSKNTKQSTKKPTVNKVHGSSAPVNKVHGSSAPVNKVQSDEVRVKIGIIRFKKAGIFRAFLPDSNVVIDVLNDTGFNRDFEVFFKKKKPTQFQWVIKVEANLLTLQNLSKLASKIRRFIGETIFNIANAGEKIKVDEIEAVEWNLDEDEE